MKKQYGVFKKYPLTDREGKRLRIKSDADLARFLRSFLTLTETSVTPYKRKKPGRSPTYDRKAHWINGRKVDGQAWDYLRKWLDKADES